MKQYHKIQTVYSRDPETKYKTLLEGKWACDEFEYLRNNMWLFTEKVDGTNIRVMYDPAATTAAGFITFGGKTDKASIPAKLIMKLYDLFHPQTKWFAAEFDTAVCLYGEGFGPGIQKGGGNYGAEQDFVLFDVRVGEWWLRQRDVEDIAKKLGIQIVPDMGQGTLFDFVERVRGGIKSAWGDFAAEGLVARPSCEMFARNGQRIITKLKCRDFPVPQ